MTKRMLVPVLLILFLCSIRSQKQFLEPPAATVSQMIHSSGLPELSRPVQPENKQTGIVPARLYIPAIDLHADIEPVGIKADGSMDVPRDTEKVGFLSTGVLPGGKGNAVMDGHVDNYTGPAVFFHLRDLKPGDVVIIKDKRGAYIEFAVDEVKTYKTSEAPVAKIFGQTDEARLNLITCAGRYSRKKREHEARLVIYTKRLSATSSGVISPSKKKGTDSPIH